MIKILDNLCRKLAGSDLELTPNRTVSLFNTTIKIANLAASFTNCIEQSIFIWIPCLIIWLISPFWFCLLSKKRYFAIRISWLLITRSVIVSLLIINQLAYLTNLIIKREDWTERNREYIIHLISSVVLIISFVSIEDWFDFVYYSNRPSNFFKDYCWNCSAHREIQGLSF